MSESTPPRGDLPPGLIGRPNGQLHDYPVEVRWEVTRRHPYYLAFWQAALSHRRLEPGDESDRALLGMAATVMLASIGVGGELVPPEQDFASLMEGNPSPEFLASSVQPITLRALLATLINVLTPAECVDLGLLLWTAGCDELAIQGDDERRARQKSLALANLMRFVGPRLDSCIAAPLFYIHLGASERSIASDVRDQVKRWKARQGLGSAKVHTAGLASYLEVWDLREGWTGSGYDRTRELTFAAVGERLEIRSTSTVASRYKSAFEMITGHPFSPELWWRLFGPLKCSVLLGGPAATLSAPVLRHYRTPARRDVPESVVSPPTGRDHEVGFAEWGTAVGDDIGQMDLLMDLRDLIGRGLSDEAIARELELLGPEEVAYFRSRTDDFPRS